MGAAKLLTAAGGGITLDAASTATDKTITIPADNGTLVYANSSSNVGIGTSSPAAKLQVKSSGEQLRIETTGAVASGGAVYQTWYDSTGSRQAYIGFGGASNTFQINLDASGPLTFSTAGNERARIDSSGQLHTKDGAGNIKPDYGCRAWVHFDGKGSVPIQASGNVSSITDNGVGIYTLNFSTAMSDTNYAISGATTGNNSNLPACVSIYTNASEGYAVNKTTSSVQIRTGYGNNSTGFDFGTVCVAVFR